MWAIITCFESCEPFGFLTHRIPVSMLPVLNKPLLEHLLEQCADAGLKHVRIALVENPMPVRRFLGNGERWGLDIRTWDFKEPCTNEILVSRLASDYTGPLLVIPAETLIDLDFSALNSCYESGRQRTVRVLAADACRRLEAGIADEQGRNTCAGEPPCDTGIRLFHAPFDPRSSEETFVCEGKWVRVVTPAKLWEANTAALHGDFPSTLPSQGRVTGHRKWVGHHCKVDPQATIEPPVFIGDHVCIYPGAEIKSGAVIGNRVIVDSHALVESSVVMDCTYIGTHINVVDRIASGNYVLNVRAGSTLKVDDPVIISSLEDKILAPAARRLVDKVIALTIFLVTCPIWMIVGLARLARRKPFFDTTAFVVVEGVPDGTIAPYSSRANLRRFTDGHSFISRLPGLWDVIAGRLALVGVRPLSEEEMQRITEDWMMVRFEAPAGLFTLLDSLASSDLDDEEKLVIENYYAGTRRLTTDLKILCQSLFRLIFGR